MQEKWKDIPGYEGMYQVSNLGSVRSLPRYIEQSGYVRTMPGKILKYNLNSKGYARIFLSKPGCKYKQPLVHRLVAEAFIPNPKDLPQVNHKDTKKTNNAADNLEWIDGDGNQQHRRAMEKSNGKV